MKKGEEQLFLEFLEIIRRLRGPEGCPWDREQTPHSLRDLLIEEVYEVLEAIAEEDSDHLREELGDVLLLICMLARMQEEALGTGIAEVLEEINAKLIRRHPHVFGEAQAADALEVLQQWNRIKTDIEGRETSVFSSVPGSLPPLERGFELQKRAARLGFDWPSKDGPLMKLREELTELEKALESSEKKNIEEEVGDVFFSMVNLARHLDVNPLLALAGANAKFERRFRHVVERMESEDQGKLERMDAYWEEAKSEESP